MFMPETGSTAAYDNGASPLHAEGAAHAQAMPFQCRITELAPFPPRVALPSVCAPTAQAFVPVSTVMSQDGFLLGTGCDPGPGLAVPVHNEWLVIVKCAKNEPIPTWLGTVELQCVNGFGQFPGAPGAAAGVW